MFQQTAHHAYRSRVPAHCTSCIQVACSSSLHITHTGRVFQLTAHHAYRSCVPAHCTSCIQVVCSSSLHIMQTGRMFQLTAQTLWEKTISLTCHNMVQLTAHHAYRSYAPAVCTSCVQVVCSSSLHTMHTGDMFQLLSLIHI